jgi:hypothetical protein
LPLDLYYFIYFVIITILFVVYVKKTKLNLKERLSKRLVWGLILGLVFAVFMAINVLSRPETVRIYGHGLIWALLWRGLIYGAIDGLLLTVFPWIVTWRAFDAENRTVFQKIAISLLAWIFIIVATTSYHLGYSDFRSTKVFQANVGNTIMSVATLLSGNPIGTPIAHSALHITAVLHSPETELFLPPHK